MARNKKEPKHYVVNGVKFSKGDYEKIMAAISLRVGACRDNGERQKAAAWNRVGLKIVKAFVPFKE